MTIRRVSIKLIETAVSDSWIRQLAFFHLLKFRFNNGCIYQYKSRMDEIASGLNISTKTLYNYINFLRAKELLYEHSNNLKLRSIHDYKTFRKKCILNYSENYKLFDITCLLYCKLIERKAQHQAFMVSMRRYGRGDRFKSNPCENPFRPSMSYRTIAKLLKISESKAFRVIENLNRLEVVKTTKQNPKMIIRNMSEIQYYIEDLPGYRFAIGNRLFELYGCRHDFLQFPIQLKTISILQYKRHISSGL